MVSTQNSSIFLKKIIYFFYIYMIIEGVIRKWIFADYFREIYFIKDFFLIFIYVYALKFNYLFTSKLSKIIIFLTILVCLVGSLGYNFDSKNEILYYFIGVRSYWLFLPLTLIVMHLFKPSEIFKFFEINLYFVLPLFILVYIQSVSSYESVINSGYNSIVFNPERPSGYFTFTTQNVFYLIFLSICFFSTLLKTQNLSFIKIIYFILLNFMIFSIMILLKSRAVYLFLFCTIFYSFFFLLISGPINKKLYKILFLLIITPLIFIICSKIFDNQYEFSASRMNTDTYTEMQFVKEYKNKKISLFSFSKKNNEPFSRREFTISRREFTISEFCAKNSSICRVINEIYFVSELKKAKIFGHGIGAGTSPVMALKKQKNFSLGEVENYRIIQELGYIFGTLLLSTKFFVVIFLNIIFLIKYRKFIEYSPILVFISVQLAIGSITMSVSFISFIFWFCLGIFLRIFNKNFKESYQK